MPQIANLSCRQNLIGEIDAAMTELETINLKESRATVTLFRRTRGPLQTSMCNDDIVFFWGGGVLRDGVGRYVQELEKLDACRLCP